MFFSVNTAFGASYTMNTNYTFQNPTFYQILDNRSEKFENNFIPFLDNVSNATEFCLTYSGSYSTHTSKGFSWEYVDLVWNDFELYTWVDENILSSVTCIFNNEDNHYNLVSSFRDNTSMFETVRPFDFTMLFVLQFFMFGLMLFYYTKKK